MSLALLATGCVTQAAKRESVDPKVLEQHETRLLQPFRSGSTIVCRRLVIEANPVLQRNLTLPAGSGEKVEVNDVEEVRWRAGTEVKTRASSSPAGGGPPPGQSGWKVNRFMLMIGNTTFQVDDEVVLRRLLRAPPTLTAQATGHVIVIQHGANQAQRFQEVRFIDGRVEAR